MKRRRGDTLTGGTRDFNPQYFSTSVTQSANDTTTTAAISTPPGIGLSVAGRPLAMEILKLLISFDNGTGPWQISSASYAPGATTAAIPHVDLFLSSKNFGTTVPALGNGDATVFGYARRALHLYESSAVGYTATIDSDPIEIDLSDGAGHGVLYANQNIYAQISSGGTGGTNTARIKMLYREKYITEEELLGLVLQSNQN